MMSELAQSPSIEDSIRELLAEMLHPRFQSSALAATDDLYGAGLSSLATVDLMLAIEDRFDIEFTNSWLNRRTFASIAALSNAVRHMQEDAP
jgi:acyl carrier protein